MLAATDEFIVCDCVTLSNANQIPARSQQSLSKSWNDYAKHSEVLFVETLIVLSFALHYAHINPLATQKFTVGLSGILFNPNHSKVPHTSCGKVYLKDKNLLI